MPHGLSVNDLVVVSGVDATLNGTYTVTAVDITGRQFSYSRLASSTATALNLVNTAASAARGAASAQANMLTSARDRQRLLLQADGMTTSP